MAATLKPEDILTPEELAARLKVRKSWVYEQTRSRNQNPLPRLNMGRYLRFDSVSRTPSSPEPQKCPQQCSDRRGLTRQAHFPRE